MSNLALVTGSSRGIDKSTIIEFASKEFDIVIKYCNGKTEAEELKRYIERFEDSIEIAKIIYFFANDESSYINGKVVNVEGGYC